MQNLHAEIPRRNTASARPVLLNPAARNENFAVASRLLPRHVAPKVVAFYNFARAADDCADDPTASASVRLAALEALESGLLHGHPDNPGAALRRTLGGSGAALDAARDLLAAFRRDATGIACADWSDLMGYCASSAVPVGRFLLIVNDAGRAAQPPSDALCAALQILNHVQDMGDDWRLLRRRYLPGDWMAEAGADDADLAAPTLTPALRRVVQRTLDASDALLRDAAPLPRRIATRGLRMQAAATIFAARRLSARLRAGDPLADRIALSRLDFARAGLQALRFAP
ncbi:hypothetical protein OCGS_2155 [Oceaniovalibus guishaninsula JLT2003]|uniref:Squalene synthase HpnC n=1 Tax=Oceaniovalibus guishaninsula JLT2003 TaxID=1231392 RepID=K2GM64_9RHOB|nr:squalene/phytoene synthase family protein [Oceaniovalibus guishaninsula]EKE43821.1 hypothetical protein OCGS_2155 [Oceaniovalibus guishaninsula JLT2003]